MLTSRVPSLLCSAVCLALFAQPDPVSAAPVEIRSCGATLSTPGDYVLAQDIGPCPGTGIAITASNVNLDLAGNTIGGAACNPGQPQTGIDIRAGTEFVEVRGGTVAGFTHGVNVDGSGHTLRALRLLDPCSTGATVAGELHGLQGLQVRGGDVGIRARASAISIASTVISGSRQYGIELNIAEGGVYGALLTGNVLLDNGHVIDGGAAIAALASSDGSFLDNTLLNNAAGMALGDADRNFISGNTVNGSTNSGIALSTRASSNTLVANFVRGNAVDLSEDNACAVNQWTNNEFTSGIGCVGQPAMR